MCETEHAEVGQESVWSRLPVFRSRAEFKVHRLRTPETAKKVLQGRAYRDRRWQPRCVVSRSECGRPGSLRMPSSKCPQRSSPNSWAAIDQVCKESPYIC